MDKIVDDYILYTTTPSQDTTTDQPLHIPFTGHKISEKLFWHVHETNISKLNSGYKCGRNQDIIQL